jgi:hypothetical protein
MSSNKLNAHRLKTDLDPLDNNQIPPDQVLVVLFLSNWFLVSGYIWNGTRRGPKIQLGGVVWMNILGWSI